MIRSAWKNYRQLTSWQKARKAMHYVGLAGILAYNGYLTWQLKQENAALSRQSFAHWDMEDIFRSIMGKKREVISIDCNVNGQKVTLSVDDLFKKDVKTYIEYQDKIYDRSCRVRRPVNWNQDQPKQ